MDSTDHRQQRASMSFPYLEPFSDALSMGDQTGLTDVDMDEAWRLFDLQSPQCVSHDQQTAMGSAFRTPHDDLCAYPPKCPTAGYLGGTGYAGHGAHAGYMSSSHMLFHTRHFDPHIMTGQMPGLGGITSAMHGGGLHSMDLTTGAFFSLGASSALSSPTAAAPPPPPPLLAPPPNPKPAARDGEDDTESTCDSDCGMGEICHDSACSEDPSVCCEDEGCLQAGTSPDAATPISSDDAVAAAALASFVDEQRQAREQQELMRATSSSAMHSQQGHFHPASSTPTPSCLQFGLGPDLCISPEFLTNYQHLREAHDPLNPSACNATWCPIEDPNFYQECHIRHTHQHQGDFFDNIDLNLMMAGHHSHDHVDAIECGAKFPSGEAMVQHLWNEHRLGLGLFQPQQAVQMDHQAPGITSSASPSVSLSSHDLASTPSLMPSGQNQHPAILPLPDGSMPLAAFGLDHSDHSDHKPKDLSQSQEAAVRGAQTGDHFGATLDSKSQEAPTKHECQWCDAVGGQPCNRIFESAGDLHKHVLAAHTHSLKRDAGGTYSCGWQGCTRRDNEEKGGFAQKSKIDRHMQVHTGNKPFLCDICHQSFSANQALLQHKLIHEDSKPLSCEICGKTFRQHSALIRPLKCPYCKKEFSESSNLSKHKRIHTGEGQYECKFPGCNRVFHRKDQLRRHSTQHSKGPSSAIAKPLTLTV